MIKVNLLKPEQKDVSGSDPSSSSDFVDVKEEKVNIPGAIIVAVLTIGVIAFLYITKSSELEASKKLREERRTEETKLKAQLKDVGRLKKLKAELKLRISTIQLLKKKQKQPIYMMLEISKSIPERVWITKLVFNGSKIRIYGIALSNNLVSTFAKNIESSPYFRNLNFGGFNKKNNMGIDVFSFSFSVDFVLSNIKEGV